jgi:hypothetical protein
VVAVMCATMMARGSMGRYNCSREDYQSDESEQGALKLHCGSSEDALTELEHQLILIEALFGEKFCLGIIGDT